MFKFSAILTILNVEKNKKYKSLKTICNENQAPSKVHYKFIYSPILLALPFFLLCCIIHFVNQNEYNIFCKNKKKYNQTSENRLALEIHSSSSLISNSNKRTTQQQQQQL
jgi:hypothetical protein